MPKKPEKQAPPQFYYDETVSKKYSKNSRIVRIQRKMAERAFELMQVPKGPAFVLDIGCGSGISSTVLAENGYSWIGVDISFPMLQICKSRHINPQVIHLDIGMGLPFRESLFDGCISISVLQWLCEAASTDQNPLKRIRRFFESLYRVVKPGRWSVFQFYPENKNQVELLQKIAMRCGFKGGIVVDFPESRKSKKHYLVLRAGGSSNSFKIPIVSRKRKEKDQESALKRNKITFSSKIKRPFYSLGKREIGSKLARASYKQRLIDKKNSLRLAGKKIPRDSKYSGRKRRRFN